MGLDPARSTGIGTAARMENAAIVEETYEELKVAACVTAGVEGNAGCAGDPAGYYGAGARPEIYRPGTINILLFINADMPPGILTRALVTCTEGKTAALRELMVGSRYSEILPQERGQTRQSSFVIRNHRFISAAQGNITNWGN